jgi:hypothetical protein
MHNQRQLSRIVFIIILLVGLVHLVFADAAPPQQPPAGSIESGGFDTHVQMVSEEVLMLVDVAENRVSDQYVAANHIQAHVEATFWMQNQGEETESFDVWFPLGVPDGYSEVSVVDNFGAWVDDVPAEIGQEIIVGQWDEEVPWATWPVTFPPGETVVLTVAYNLRATGYYPYGELVYILETGAGWWGTIGEGTVTVRLPYDVNEHNVTRYSAPGRDGCMIDDFEIDGTDLIWHFSDLEPTNRENIRVNAMAPSVWSSVLEAEELVTENPDSAGAYLELAEAQARGLEFKYGLICCEALADAATANFQQALALEPEAVDVQIGYLDLLLSLWFPYVLESYSEDIPTLVQELLISAPDDDRFLDMLSQAVGSFQWALEVNPDESEGMQAAYDAVMAAVRQAAKANSGNTRLNEIAFPPPTPTASG